MNIIFLDIDGVMNSNNFYLIKHNTQKKEKIKRYFNITIRSWIRYIHRYISGIEYTETEFNNFLLIENFKLIV